MADETKSIVKRTESAIDDFLDLWRRRKLICLLVLLFLMAPGGFGAYLQFVKIPQLQAAAREQEKKAASEKEALRSAEESHRDLLGEKTAKIQELETELAPFRTFALLKFSSSDSQAMMKLAEHLQVVDSELKATKEEVEQLKLKADFPRWRKIADIRPDGRRVSWAGGHRETGTGTVSKTGSAIEEILHKAFKALDAKDLAAASAAFKQVTEELPDWPYGHYFLGSLTGSRNSIESAAQRFRSIREVGIYEPELVLFESLCYVWLGEFSEARVHLANVDHPMMKPENIPFLVIPEAAPADVAERVKNLAKQIGVPLLVWKPRRG